MDQVVNTPDEGSCYIFSARNNCCELFASYGVFMQSVTQSFMVDVIYLILPLKLNADVGTRINLVSEVL